MKTLLACLALAAFSLLPATAKEPEYLRYYDPAASFKPAEANLTNIFLQLAGSLEAHGTPEPYIKHVLAEHKRVAALYEAKTGSPLPSRLPAYMTTEYIDQLLANWRLLEPKLRLDNLSRDTGLCIREGIRGTHDDGTILVGIFNRHQQLVADGMQNRGEGAGFAALQSTLKKELELEKPDVDMRGYNGSRTDAVSYGQILRGTIVELYEAIDSSVKAETATQFKGVISSMFVDVGRFAQAELEIGIIAAALK